VRWGLGGAEGLSDWVWVLEKVRLREVKREGGDLIAVVWVAGVGAAVVVVVVVVGRRAGLEVVVLWRGSLARIGILVVVVVILDPSDAAVSGAGTTGELRPASIALSVNVAAWGD
jgi:hypothetical protein